MPLAEEKVPVEMTAEELAEEEWGPTKEKGKKKKSKKEPAGECDPYASAE